jgi:TolB-like protein/DNA-binding winged helix-turn-helix (wHTH) protein/Tfp pilus assembly protein PilF
MKIDDFKCEVAVEFPLSFCEGWDLKEIDAVRPIPDKPVNDTQQALALRACSARTGVRVRMKSFRAYRLDTVNHLLWHNGDRVPVPPKGFDVLAYLVENVGRVVTQDEILQALWPDTYVNPEVLRKYILEIRKTLGDRAEKPEFIETLPKRGYRFVAPVKDEIETGKADLLISDLEKEPLPEAPFKPETTALRPKTLSIKRLWQLALMALLVLIVSAAIDGSFRSARNGTNALSANDTSIVVLPFADMSPAKDQEYFSDGLSEQLIHDLAKVSGLKVVGRSSAFQFKGKNEDLREVGRKLGVANVLEGSVRREGNHVRITAELTKANDGFQLWSQTYDRNIKDIFAVQDEIAWAATEALQVKLLGGNGQPIPLTLGSANPEAYEAYLQGRYILGQGHNKGALEKALAYADRAIKLDEKYAPAWALRATVKSRMAGFSLIDMTEGYRSARDNAERAIALDPNSASGYRALARVQNDYDWDWEAANSSITKAAALEPGSADIFGLRAYMARELGHFDEAIRLLEQAIALDPLRPDYHLGLGYQFYLAARYDEAHSELQKTLDLNPQATFAHASLGKILLVRGKPQEALAEIDKEPSEWERLTCLVMVYHALGREQDSNAALSELVAKYGTDSAYQIAEGYAFRGETDKSFEWLERAYKQRDGGMTDIKIDPLFRPLLHDRRYAELLKKMRLPYS